MLSELHKFSKLNWQKRNAQSKRIYHRCSQNQENTHFPPIMLLVVKDLAGVFVFHLFSSWCSHLSLSRPFISKRLPWNGLYVYSKHNVLG